MKKIIALVLFISVFFAIPTSFAQENNTVQSNNEVMSTLEVTPTLSISKFSDGRVAPVKDVFKLSVTELDNILKEMKFNDSDLKSMNNVLKRTLVSNGGIKVEVESSGIKEYYTSLNGEEYLITEENKSEINEIKKNDLKVMLENQIEDDNNGITPFYFDIPIDSLVDGILGLSTFLVYNGKTSNGLEFQLDFYTDYYWDGRPNFPFTDVIAQSWSQEFTRKSTTGTNYYKFSTGNTFSSKFSFSNSIGGSKGTFNLISAENNWGSMISNLVIPVTNQGLTKEVITVYSHPYTSTTINVILNFLDIEISPFWGAKFEMGGSFTVPSA